MGWFKRRAEHHKRTRKTQARAPDGVTVYAIGDIHGRLDLLNRLLDLIAADMAASKTEETVLIFLGDYVDRGPNSRLVIETLIKLKDGGVGQVITLKGNHEAALTSFLEDPAGGPSWADHGGRETALSYGVAFPRDRQDAGAWEEARDRLVAALPAHHLDFLRGLGLCTRVGDYLFAHAGVRPGVAIDQQVERDLLWIRHEFLNSKRALDEIVVVHGHTPVEQPSIAPGRIGIDTGAYATGVLTALRLRGAETSFLQTDGGLNPA